MANSTINATINGLNSTGGTTAAVEIQTAGTTAMTVNSSQNVGIGTSSPNRKLEVTGAFGADTAMIRSSYSVDTTYYREFGRNNSSGAFEIRRAQGGAATTDFTIDTSGNTKFSGNIGIGGTAPTTSGTGITFPATQVASSDVNTLDDYEEGTWTATLTCGTSGTITLNDNSGKYTKVGRIVNVSGYFTVTSVSSPTGRLKLGGLPFAQVADGVPVCIAYLVTTNAFTGVPWCVGDQNVTILIDRNAGTGADPAIDLSSAIKANTELYINATYTTT